MTAARADPDHDALLECPQRNHVVVAPPGTGKTHVAVRLAGDLAGGMRPHERVLLLTFSNQARVQLEREARRQLDHAIFARVEISNYHRFFWRAVRAYRRALGLPMGVQIASRQRRRKALEAVGIAEARQLVAQDDQLIDSLAELAFPEFRDERSPADDLLGPLLRVVQSEQAAGNLVFDDLGALFWRLMLAYPHVQAAYSARYPVVIADEHQDASALQDAVVRLLGWRNRIVFADPMQMIYGFRGASSERLAGHLNDCRCSHEFCTPHRWHGSPEVASWLLAVRSRLMGGVRSAEKPQVVRIERTRADHGRNAVVGRVRIEVSRLFATGISSAAVLARRNDDVAVIRNHLSKSGMFPRQIGGAEDFEEARQDIECLPSLLDACGLANHALDRLQTLVPTLSTALMGQVRGRLGVAGVDTVRCSAKARLLLDALSLLYTEGGAAYFVCMAGCLDVCASLGDHLPRRDAVRALRETAWASPGASMEEALGTYAQRAVAGSECARYTARGLFVMTAHQSKGKEFDAVVFAGLSRSNFPDDDESRRLLYVALTRARSGWVIIAPDRDESPLLDMLL